MSDKLLKKIADLEETLQAKEAELAQMRLRLQAVNSRLENLVQKVSAELSVAHKIQELMSPTEIPTIPGFHFSSKFVASLKSGGDYYDLFEHQDKLRFGLLLAASSGYTMSALFMSVLLKLSFKMQSKQSLDPHEALYMISEEVKKEQATVAGRTSVFYGVIDRRSYELKYNTLGYIAAIIVQAEPERVYVLPSEQTQLGDKVFTPLEPRKITLGAKDRIILCSDGVTEAKNTQGQMWGLDSVVDLVRQSKKLSAHELRNEILFQCEKHSQNAALERDRTVLVIEVKENILKLAGK